MATNKEQLTKGMQYLFGALPLFFIGPSVMYNAFMNKNNNWHYLVLVIGIAICLSAMFFAFKGLKTIVDAIFNDGK